MSINTVWNNICKHEGETFFTISDKKPYTYTIKDDHIILSDRRGKISRSRLENAIQITDPTPKKVGGWAPSYICGIITDSRII